MSNETKGDCSYNILLFSRLIGHLTSNYSLRFLTHSQSSSEQVIQSDAKSKKGCSITTKDPSTVIGISGPHPEMYSVQRTGKRNILLFLTANL